MIRREYIWLISSITIAATNISLLILFAKSILGPTPVLLPLGLSIVMIALAFITGKKAILLKRINDHNWYILLISSMIFGGLIPFNIWIFNTVLYAA
ncbi:MAG: hypothetical protein GY729_15995 [Desulfobacteraceae bacterium]|nr:hypothetical protein [Desulfobacteraceae bacterium]